MKPIDQVRALYNAPDCARVFTDDLQAHLAGGYVWASPTCFVMARPVPYDATVQELNDLSKRWDGRECNTMWVFAAAGDMREMLALVEPLPFLGWARRGNPRIYRWWDVMGAIGK